MWSQSPEIPGRCSVVSGAGAGIKGPFLQKVFQFLQPLYHMICFMRSSHIFQFRLFHLLPAKPAGLHPCCLSACDISSQGIPYDHTFLCPDSRKLFQTSFKKTYIRLDPHRSSQIQNNDLKSFSISAFSACRSAAHKGRCWPCTEYIFPVNDQGSPLPLP